MQLDVSNLNSLPEKVAQIEKIFGHIDILINNAGISVRSNVVSMAVDLDVQVMLVNYFGTIAITKGKIFCSIKGTNLLQANCFHCSGFTKYDKTSRRTHRMREQRSGKILVAPSICICSIKTCTSSILRFTSCWNGRT